MGTHTEEHPPKQSPPNLFSLIPKFHFQFPFLPNLLPPQPSPPPPQSDPQDETPNLKRNVVRFPKTQAAVVSSTPLQAEVDVSNSPAARTTNPLLLWQVFVVFLSKP